MSAIIIAKSRKIIYLIISGLFILNTSMNAQEGGIYEPKYWIETGLGGYSEFGGSEGFTIHLAVNSIHEQQACFFWGYRLYKIRILGNHEWPSTDGDRPFEIYYNLGLLFGKGISWTHAQGYFSGGVGFTTGIKRGEFLNVEPLDQRNYFKLDRFISISVPMEIEFVLKPEKFACVGIMFFLDINSVRPGFGFVYKIGAGNLR